MSARPKYPDRRTRCGHMNCTRALHYHVGAGNPCPDVLNQTFLIPGTGKPKRRPRASMSFSDTEVAALGDAFDALLAHPLGKHGAAWLNAHEAAAHKIAAKLGHARTVLAERKKSAAVAAAVAVPCDRPPPVVAHGGATVADVVHQEAAR